ncbi:MAG: serine protease, partial [Halothece sp.]
MTTQSNNSQSHTNRKRPLQKAATYLSLVMLGVGATISGDYFLSQPNRTFEAKNAQAVEGIKEASPVIAQTITPIPTNGNFVTNVVQEVGPAVVRIDASRTVSTNLPKVFNDPAFRRFFGSQIPDIPDQQIRRGMGSGVIINDNGQI